MSTPSSEPIASKFILGSVDVGVRSGGVDSGDDGGVSCGVFITLSVLLAASYCPMVYK